MTQLHPLYHPTHNLSRLPDGWRWMSQPWSLDVTYLGLKSDSARSALLKASREGAPVTVALAGARGSMWLENDQLCRRNLAQC